MKHKFSKFCAVIVFLLSPLVATAAPGWQASGLTILPQNGPAVVEALDKWMSSKSAKGYKGRLYLIAHIADGTDPATHTLMGLFNSAAEQESFSMSIQKSPADYAELMSTVVPIATLVQTTRGVSVKSWGDVSDDDMIWVGHSIRSTDPAGVVRAMDGFLNSALGKKHPGQVHLGAVVAGGLDSPTHLISIGFKSEAEMEKYNESIQGNPVFANFLTQLRAASEYMGTDLSRVVKTWGSSSLGSVTN